MKVVSVSFHASLALAAVVLASARGVHYNSEPCRTFASGFQTVGSVDGPKSFTSTYTDNNATDTTRYTTTGLAAASGAPISTGMTCSVSAPATLCDFDAGVSATGFRVGEAATYLDTDNEGLCAAAWADSGTPVCTADTTAAPDGNTTADSVQDDSASVDEYRALDLTVTANTVTYSATVYARCASAHLTNLCLSISAGGGCTPSTTCHQFTCSTTAWQRASVVKANASCTNLQVQLKPTGDAAGSTGTTIFWRPEVYAEGAPKFFDPAITAQTAFSADALTYAAVPFNEDVGTFCGWFYVNDKVQTSTVWEWNGTAQMRMQFTQPSETIRFETLKLTDNGLAISNESLTQYQWEHVCATWDRNGGAGEEFDVYLNGAEVTYSDAPDSFSQASADAGKTYGTTLAIAPTALDDLLVSHVTYCTKPMTAAWVGRQYRKYQAQHE